MEKLTVTVKEMADIVGVSRCTAYELIHQQGFPVVWLGKRAVIPIEGLKKWLNEQAQAGVTA